MPKTALRFHHEDQEEALSVQRSAGRGPISRFSFPYPEMVRGQRVEVQVEPGGAPSPPAEAAPLSRPARAHWRLSWAQRLTRNARARAADPVTILLFGIPDAFARFLGLATG